MASAKNGCHFFVFKRSVQRSLVAHIRCRCAFSRCFLAHLFCECAMNENFAYFYSFLFGNS